MAGYLHRTAQPLILATFLSWGGSAGAGRVRPAGANVGQMRGLKKLQLLPVLGTIYSCKANQLIIRGPGRTVINQDAVIVLRFKVVALCFGKII